MFSQKYPKTFFIVLLILMLISALLFFLNFEYFRFNPFNTSFQLKTPIMVVDSKDNIYVVSNTWREILKIDNKGRVVYRLKGGNKKDMNSFFEAWLIGVDKNDNLYVYNVVFDSETGLIEREEIKKYDSNGNFEKILYILDYGFLKLKVSTGEYKIKLLKFKDNFAYFLLDEANDKGGIYRINVEDNNVSKVVSIDTVSNIDSFGFLNDNLVVLDRNSKFYIYDNNLKKYKVYYDKGSYSSLSFCKNIIYFVDTWNLAIKSFSSNGSKVVVSKETINSNDDVFFPSFDANYSSGNLVGFEAYSKSIFYFYNSGKIKGQVKDFKISYKEFYLGILNWVFILLFFGILFFIIYKYFFKEYLSLIVKIAVILVLAFIGAMVYVGIKSYSDVYNRFEKEVLYRLTIFARTSLPVISPDFLEKIKSPSDYDKNALAKIFEQKSEVESRRTEEDMTFSLRIQLLVLRNNRIYLLGDPYTPYFYPHIYPYGYYDDVFKNGKIKYDKYSNYYGNYFSAAVPIKKGEKVVGAIEAFVYSEEYKDISDQFRNNLIKSIIYFSILFVLITVFVVLLLIYPLKVVSGAMLKVGNGQLDQFLDIKRRDEIGTISKSFNEMLRSLIEKERIRSVMNKVVSKEIAQKLLQTELKLGGERVEGTVFFSDIRGFTSLSENMSPEEVIDMLNQYFSRMSKIIEENYGIIDKYVGDEIMAVYGGIIPLVNDAGERVDAFYAIKTGLEFMRVCNEINREREAGEKKPIQIGIGINSGVFVAGNMGSENRLNYTVIGDDVNLGARLCSNAPAMTIIISESTYVLAKDFIEAEELEPIKVKGKANLIKIYKVIGLKVNK